MFWLHKSEIGVSVPIDPVGSMPDLSIGFKKNEISSIRTGIIIQKKFVKLAVNRNYIKRKFREIIMRSELNSFDAVLMVKNKIEEFDKLKVKKNFIDLESKIEKI